jgi:hypothetical protein
LVSSRREIRSASSTMTPDNDFYFSNISNEIKLRDLFKKE